MVPGILSSSIQHAISHDYFYNHLQSWELSLVSKARRKIRLQVRLGLNSKKNCKAPARNRGHLGRGCFSILDQKGRLNRLKVTGLVSGGVGTRIPNLRGNMRPVGNSQLMSHLAHGGRDSSAIQIQGINNLLIFLPFEY